jgi:hypothetical protein
MNTNMPRGKNRPPKSLQFSAAEINPNISDIIDYFNVHIIHLLSEVLFEF